MIIKDKVKKLIITYDFWFFIVLVIGIFLRFYKIDLQSLWNDELATYTWLSGRFNSFEKVISSCKADVHPPFYFLIANFWLKFVLYSEMSLRYLSAIFGSFGIVAIYYYGKRYFNPYTGLCAALLTSFNYFHILHSQNARPYSLLFLLSVLSYFTFSYLIEKLDIKYLIYYVLSTTALIYTHYFGLFVLVSQSVYILIIMFINVEKRKDIFKYYSISGILITILYSPWTVHIIKNLDRKSWIGKPKVLFFIDYFKIYLGSKELYYFFLLVLLIFLTVIFLKFIKKQVIFVKQKNKLNTVLLLNWIFITLVLPYIKSINSGSMLTVRNTMVTFPAIILLFSFFISFLRNKGVKILVLILLFSFSFRYLFIQSGYYSKIRREQWRNVVLNVLNNYEQSDLVASGRETQYFQEYFKLIGSNINVILFSKQTFINVFKNKSNNRIWILNAHLKNEELPVDKLISKYFYIEKEFNFLKSGCTLYRIFEDNRKKMLLYDKAEFIKEKLNGLSSSWIIQEGSWIGKWERIDSSLKFNAVWKNSSTKELIKDLLEVSDLKENGEIKIYRKGMNNFYSGKIDYKNKTIKGLTGWQTGWSAVCK